MSIVTDIETVDDQYCFCLRLGEKDRVLFAFRTEKEALIAADALRQIEQHAVDILPAADANAGDRTPAETDAVESDDGVQSDTAATTENPGKAATSPFLGR